MKNIIILFLIIAIAASCKQSKPVDYLKEGTKNFYESKFKDAIEDFNKAINAKVDFAEAYFMRGNCKQNIGDTKGALDDYSSAIKYQENYYQAYFNRAWIKRTMKDLKGACEDFKKAKFYGKESVEEELKYCN